MSGPGGDADDPAMRRIALLLVLAVAATACGSDLGALGGHTVRRDPGAPGGLPATAVPEPAATFVRYGPTVCPFASQAAHGLTVECSELVVPSSRAPGAGIATVKLAVARIRSTSATPKADPVVYLEGGPGGSALSSIDFWTSPPAPFLAERDLILVDQRGTGYSTPRLTCDQLTDDVYGSLAVRFTEDCVRVLRNQGADLDAFDTTESALDLYDLRKAMGIAEWNLFGISYGTRLALWTVQTRPQGIRSIVIDSVYPPAARLHGTVADGFVRAVRAVAADCAAQPSCAAEHPDLEAELVRAVDRLNAEWEGEGDDFARYLFQSMYATSVAAVVPKAIGLAAAGRVSQAVSVLRGARAGLAGDASPGIASRPHMSEALYQSVECAESIPTTSGTVVREAARALPASLAKPFVDDELRLLAVCQAWKVDPNPLVAVRSDVPALVLAGTYDPITPPSWAEMAASTLPNSRYQLVAGSGHGTWLAGDCPRQLVTAFLGDPVAKAGPECPGAPPTFA